MFFGKSRSLAMLAAAALFGAAIPNAVFSSPSQVSSPRPKRRRIVKSELIAYRGANYRYAPNGRRECARRIRQIEAGQLTAANGLREDGK